MFGFLGDSAGIMSGFNAREKENVQSRKDMAKAFADFKAANPYASAAEFQSFIDSYSGGRNYIAGGAPGSEIISALGQQNQETQAADIMRTQVSDASERSALIGDITGRAEQYLVGLEPKGNNPIDYSQAASDFYKTLGIDEEAAKSFFGDKPLTSIFNEPNRKRLQLGAIEDKLPRFLEYVKGTGGYGDQKSFDDAVTLFDIPKYMVEPMRQRVKQELKDAQIELRDDRRERLVKRARQGIADGNKNIRALIEGDAEGFGFDISSPESKAYFESVEAEATKTYNDAQLLQREERFDRLMAFAERQIKLGNASTLPNTFSTKAKSLGLDVNNAGFDQFYQEVVAEAQRNRDIEDTNIENAKQDRLATNNVSFYSALESDTTILSLIDRGEIEKAKAAITARANKFQPEVAEFLIQGIEEFLNGTIAERVIVQNAALAENRDEARGARASAETAYSTANQDKVTQFFGSIDESNPNAGPAKGNAVLAASEIAKVFDMNMATMSVLQNAWAQVPEGTSAQELFALGQKALTDSRLGVSAADGKTKAGDLAEQNSGFLGMSQTFDNWLTGLDGKTRDQFGAIENKFLAVSRLPTSTAEEAQKKIALLNALQTRIMNTTGAVSSYIQSAQDTSFGPDGWITKGTPQWDVAKISGENGFKDQVAKMQKELIDKIAEEVNNTTVPTQPTQPTAGGGSSITSTASTVAGRQQDIDAQTKERTDIVDNFRENARSKITAIGRNYSTQTDAEYQDNLALSAFLGNAYGNMNDPITMPVFSGSLTGFDDSGPSGVMDDIIKDDDIFLKFKMNPVAFMKSYKLPNGTNWYDDWVQRNQ